MGPFGGGMVHQMFGELYYTYLLLLLQEQDDENDDNRGETAPAEKKRRGPKGVIYYTNPSGERQVLTPRMSLWFNIYVDSPNLDFSRFHKQFRRRFRLPYECFLELLDEAKKSPLFGRWAENKTDALGKKAAPLQLLILSALRYLGRGWTFDDLAESTAISEEVQRNFFHEFIKFGSTTLF